MIWIYRIGLLLNTVLLVYAAFNVKVSGQYNRAVILGMILLLMIIAVAYVLKNYSDSLKAAAVLLWVPLVPALLFLLFIVLMVVLKPKY